MQIPLKMITVALLAAQGWLQQGIGAENAAADVEAIQVTEPPKIDGVLDDPAWAQVAKAHRGVMSGWTVWNAERLPPQQRIGYVCYDSNNLYVAMQAFAASVYDLVAGVGGNPYLGDCFEVHINTPERKYYHFGIDCEGTMDAASSGQIKGKTSMGPNFWSAELAIPWKALQITPKRGLRFGFNLGANNATQAKGMKVILSWGKTFTVENNETILELK